jgi:hypothetical protein
LRAGLGLERLALLAIISLPIAAWAQADKVEAPVAPAASAVAPNRHPVFGGSLDQFRDRLALKTEQLGLWQAYETSVNAYMAQHYHEVPVLANEQDAAPRQIGRLVDQLQNRLAALEDVETATKKLYAGLSAEQQTTSNQLLLQTIPSFALMTSPESSTKDRPLRKDDKKDGGMRGRHNPPGGMGGAN